MAHFTSYTYQMKRESKALRSYLNTVRKWVPQEPVIYIDDSDIVKPETNALKVCIIKTAAPIKGKVHFLITVCGNSRLCY